MTLVSEVIADLRATANDEERFPSANERAEIHAIIDKLEAILDDE